MASKAVDPRVVQVHDAVDAPAENLLLVSRPGALLEKQ